MQGLVPSLADSLRIFLGVGGVVAEPGQAQLLLPEIHAGLNC